MNQRKILIINGHPDKESFNFGLSEAYKKGAQNSNAELREINIRELKFNPNLQFGYRKRTELEPDLLEAQEWIKWADHLVWIYPLPTSFYWASGYECIYLCQRRTGCPTQSDHQTPASSSTFNTSLFLFVLFSQFFSLP